MTQELLKFENLPDVLKQNENLTARAKLAVDTELKEISGVDITTASIKDLGNLELRAKALWDRLYKSMHINKERRMPFTRRMDDVKKLFTQDEKILTGLSELITNELQRFGAEKIRRQKKSDEEKSLAQKEEIAKIDFRRHVADQINLRYIDMVHDYKSRIKSKYESLSGDELEDYKKVLSGLKVKFKIPDYGINESQYLAEDEQKRIITEVEKDIYNSLSNVFEEDISYFIKELLLGAVTQINDNKIKIEVEEEQKKRAEDAESAKMDVIFSGSKVIEPIELNKGTSVSLEYDLSTHNDYVEIIKFWVTKDLQNLTPDELKKKLSFMVTTANRELSKGDIINGLKIKEKISIRKTKI